MKYFFMVGFLCGLGTALCASDELSNQPVESPLFSQKDYTQLVRRLEVFPELKNLFVGLHAPQDRGLLTLYTKRRVILEQAMHKYELSPRLIRDIDRFNANTRPYFYRPWWKKKGFWIPALIVATTLTAGGVGVAAMRGRRKKVDGMEGEPASGGADETVLQAGVAMPQEVVALDSPVATIPSPRSMRSAASSDASSGLSFAGTDLTFAEEESGDDLPPAAGAGAPTAAIAVEIVSPDLTFPALRSEDLRMKEIIKVLESPERVVLSCDDLIYLGERAAPDAECRYGNKPRSYDDNKMKSFWDDIPRLCSRLAASCVPLADGRLGDDMTEEIIKRLNVAVNLIVYLEQEQSGRGREVLCNLLTADNGKIVGDILTVARCPQKNRIVQAVVEPLHLQGPAASAVNIIFPPEGKGGGWGASIAGAAAGLALKAAATAPGSVSQTIAGFIPKTQPLLLGVISDRTGGSEEGAAAKREELFGQWSEIMEDPIPDGKEKTKNHYSIVQNRLAYFLHALARDNVSIGEWDSSLQQVEQKLGTLSLKIDNQFYTHFAEALWAVAGCLRGNKREELRRCCFDKIEELAKRGNKKANELSQKINGRGKGK